MIPALVAGFEFSWWQGFDVHFRGGDKAAGMAKAGDLLKRYGPAYLVTSITLAAISYTGCYHAVSRGIDVPSLLARVGMQSSAAQEKVGIAGIAYVCHKASSPLRFPPTVALTPYVARFLFGRTAEHVQPKTHPA